MIYIIPAESEVKELNKLFMSFDNQELNMEYCLDKIRLGINEYMLVPGILLMFEDMMLGVTQDPQLYNRIMNVWLNFILKIHYYIVSADMLLPITTLKLYHNDISVTTD